MALFVVSGVTVSATVNITVSVTVGAILGVKGFDSDAIRTHAFEG